MVVSITEINNQVPAAASTSTMAVTAAAKVEEASYLFSIKIKSLEGSSTCRCMLEVMLLA